MGRDVGSQELREQTLRFPGSQRVEVSTGSGVCTEGEEPCLTIDLSGKEYLCSIPAIVWGVE